MRLNAFISKNHHSQNVFHFGFVNGEVEWKAVRALRGDQACFSRLYGEAWRHRIVNSFYSRLEN